MQVVNTLVSIYFDISRIRHTIKTNCTKLETVDPEMCSISIFQNNGLELTSLTHFLHYL